MITVSKAHAEDERGTQPVHCRRQIRGAEMARQPARVSAINTEVAKPVYRVRVELIEIREFLERYLPSFFFLPRWSRCTCMEPLERIEEQGTRKYVAWLKNSLSYAGSSLRVGLKDGKRRERVG